MRRGAAGIALVIVVLGALIWFVPWAARSRTAYTGTPTPPPFAVITPVRVAPGAEACVTSAAVEPRTRRVVFFAARFRGAPPVVRLRVSAPGYASAVRVAGSAYVPGGPIAATLPAAPPRSALGRVCLRNEGRRALALQGSLEFRVLSRARTTVDGRQIEPRVAVDLTEASSHSIAGNAGPVLAHVAAFRPWYVGRVSLALLALLVIAGVPAGVVFALRSAAD